jgi:arginine decarboxylase
MLGGEEVNSSPSFFCGSPRHKLLIVTGVTYTDDSTPGDASGVSKGSRMQFNPSAMFLTRGVGRHKEQLASFELALRDAGIAAFNLVSVSSIFPPRCKLVSKQRGLGRLSPGGVIFSVLSKCDTNEPHRLIGASIGVAIPADRERYGYLSEHHSYGWNERQAGDYAEDLAAQMLGSILGLDVDLDKAWDERKEQWKIAGHIVRTSHVTQTAMGKEGLWTTVLAAAVFCE